MKAYKFIYWHNVFEKMFSPFSLREDLNEVIIFGTNTRRFRLNSPHRSGEEGTRGPVDNLAATEAQGPDVLL